MRKFFYDNEWTIVKSFIYPALEFYVHKQQIFDQSDLREVPLLCALCISQMENKNKLDYDNLKSAKLGGWFADKEFKKFLKAMLDKWQPYWLETLPAPPVVKQNPHHFYFNHRRDLNRFRASMFSEFSNFYEYIHSIISIYFHNGRIKNWRE